VWFTRGHVSYRSERAAVCVSVIYVYEYVFERQTKEFTAYLPPAIIYVIQASQYANPMTNDGYVTDTIRALLNKSQINDDTDANIDHY